MGRLIAFPGTELPSEVVRDTEKQIAPADLSGLTSKEIWRHIDECPRDPLTRRPTCSGAEWSRVFAAFHAAKDRERQERLDSLPDSGPIGVGDALRILNLSTTGVHQLIYRGVLTGTKEPLGPRGFRWVVPVGEVRRLRAGIDAKLEGHDVRVGVRLARLRVARDIAVSAKGGA